MVRMPQSEDWRRLGDYVVARRRQIGLDDRHDLQKVVNVSYRTLGVLETGHRVSQNTLGAIETVLGWKPGSCRRILEGGEPVLAEDQRAADREAAQADEELRQLAAERLDRLSPAMQRGVRQLMGLPESSEPSRERHNGS
jgi:hypothetical protein